MPAVACARCSQPATRFLKLVAGGVETSLALCAGCGDAALFAAPLPASAAGLTLVIPLPRGRGRCPGCGFRWMDFERTQRLGCPACYEAHATEVLPLIARNQPDVTHRGRQPGTPVAPLQRELDGLRPPAKPAVPEIPLGELERRLAAAVAGEDFEEAARLRDALATRRTRGTGS